MGFELGLVLLSSDDESRILSFILDFKIIARPNRLRTLEPIGIPLIPYHSHKILNEIFDEDSLTHLKVRRHKIGREGALELHWIVKGPVNNLLPFFMTIVGSEVSIDFNFASYPILPNGELGANFRRCFDFLHEGPESASGGLIDGRLGSGRFDHPELFWIIF